MNLLLIIPCWFTHKWGKWKVLTNRRAGFIYWELIQERTCEKCGKVEIKKEIK